MQANSKMAAASDKFSTARKDKDFTLYTHDTGPNGWKVAHLLEELGLEYESVFLDFYPKVEHKSPGVQIFCAVISNFRIHQIES